MRFFSIQFRLLLLLIWSTTASCAMETRFLPKETSLIHVRIVEAEQLTFQYHDEFDGCGINYSASVMRSHNDKKAQGELKFSSPFPLIVGQEYLLIIGREPSPASLIVEWPDDYEEALSECEEGLHNLSLQGNDALMIWDSPYGLDGKWVMLADGNLSVNKQFSAKRMHCLYGEGECSFVRLDDFKKWKMIDGGM